MVVTFWVGCLWAIGFVAAPLLFARIPDRTLAGIVAGDLFTVVAYAGSGCAIYLLLSRLLRFGRASLRQGFSWVVILMLILTLAGKFGVQPILEQLRRQALPEDVMASVYRDQFNVWHGVASGIYVVESVLGIVLVVLQARQYRRGHRD